MTREYATHLTDMGEMDYYEHFEKEMKFNDDTYRAFVAVAEWVDSNPKNNYDNKRRSKRTATNYVGVSESKQIQDKIEELPDWYEG